MRLRSLVSALVLLVAPRLVSAQSLVIAPHGVIIDDRTRGTAVTVINRSPRAVEVDIEAQYGYPVSDSTGNTTIRFVNADEAKLAGNDATPFMVFSPRKFIIPAGRAQAVRFLAKPPADLANGEYWSRVTFTSKNAATAAPVTTPNDTGAIRIGIDLQVRTVIPIIYRRGPQKTGIEMGTPVVAWANDSLAFLRVPLKRTGSNAWLGRWRLEMIGADGKDYAGGSTMTAVYTELNPRIDIPTRAKANPIPPGTYDLRLHFETVRTDLSPRQYIVGPSEMKTVKLVVPAPKR